MPTSFFCPILGIVFTDPVMASDGHTYERSAITEWIERRGGGNSPMTRERLRIDDLRPNFALRTTISEWEAALTARSRLASTVSTRSVAWEDLDFCAFGGLHQRPAGRGGFKQIKRAALGSRNVAVASCRDGESPEVEADIMHRLGCHPHIVRFYGLTTDPRGVQHLVTEFASCGSLDNVLADLLEDDEGVTALEPLVQLTIAQQVCEAMQALAHAGVVHRDLAARNVLVLQQLRPSEPATVKVQVESLLNNLTVSVLC
jgi:hypothetical protein